MKVKNTFKKILRKTDPQAVTTVVACTVIALTTYSISIGKEGSIFTAVGLISAIMLLIAGMMLGMWKDEKELEEIFSKIDREKRKKIQGEYAETGLRIKELIDNVNSLKLKSRCNEIDIQSFALHMRLTVSKAENIIGGYELPSFNELVDISDFLFFRSQEIGAQLPEDSVRKCMANMLYIITGDPSYLSADNRPDISKINAIFSDYEKACNAEYYAMLEEYKQQEHEGEESGEK